MLDLYSVWLRILKTDTLRLLYVKCIVHEAGVYSSHDGWLMAAVTDSSDVYTYIYVSIHLRYDVIFWQMSSFYISTRLVFAHNQFKRKYTSRNMIFKFYFWVFVFCVLIEITLKKIIVFILLIVYCNFILLFGTFILFWYFLSRFVCLIYEFKSIISNLC